MKLNYYLRGLGIGIVLATLVFMALGQDKKADMTDEQVRMRAAELGMVEGGVLSAAAESEPEQESASQAEESEAQESAGIEQSEPEQESAGIEQSEPEQESAGIQESEPEPESASPQESVEPKNASPQEDLELPDESAGGSEAPVIEIRPGEGSETVSRKLEEAGLVQSASDFNAFLCDNGYSRRLAVGKHTVPADADAYRIAQILTGR